MKVLIFESNLIICRQNFVSFTQTITYGFISLLILSSPLYTSYSRPEQCISYQVKALLNCHRFQPIIDNVFLCCYRCSKICFLLNLWRSQPWSDFSGGCWPDPLLLGLKEHEEKWWICGYHHPLARWKGFNIPLLTFKDYQKNLSKFTN